MANLYTKVKKYLEDNSKTWEDTKVSLQNDGSGDYIKSWSYNIAEPTDEQLATYESSAQTEENNNAIRGTRKSAYGDIGDQLDEIFKDIDAWKTRIQSIKDANPKETE
jgi:hypothetical protein